MSRNKSYTRKVIYLCGIALLFVPISLISAPATSRDKGGGVLTKMRRDNRLSLAQLGKIDPASASMSLATLGMRGVAANILWERAIECQKKENWDGLTAALNQITKLQPNFVSVWQFQAWNVSYNISVEFDDYRHRYHWVKKGVNYLTEGIDYNEEEPLLLSDAGWFFAHKLGRADEYLQFRRLFRNDTDFHRELPVPIETCLGPDEKPDNWLVAHYWFRRAQQAVDKGAILKRLSSYYWVGDKPYMDKKQTATHGKNPLIFHSEPGKALIRFADAIEEDGYLDEKGRLAWRNAEREWLKYGDRELPSSWGINIHLNDLERASRDADRAEAELTKLTPGIPEKVKAEKLSKLTEAERKVLDIPLAARNSDQLRLGSEVEAGLRVTPSEIASAAGEEIRNQAMRLALAVEANRELARIVERYRGIVNFEYWLKRCIAEQEENTIEARRLVLNAEKAFRESELVESKELFEKAWDRWAVIFDRYPVMVDDVEGESVLDSVRIYQKLQGQLDLPFPPEGFKLMPLLMAYQDDFDYSDVTASLAEPAAESGDAVDATDAEASDAGATDASAPEPEAESSQDDTEDGASDE